MGNLCGKESSDNFATPGRIVATAPAPHTTASVPASRKVGGPPRTLGGSDASVVPRSSDQQADARRRAAEAAESRAREAKKPAGKLGTQLAEQKKQTRKETLAAVSQDERRMRDVDEAAKARFHT
ncbi:MAG: hypothetical protein M1818_007534 [Claussenomyces sp. TS43310]|nr:MAG: hypothetical protein M1818_007534 [Claussenomyces sp. TS43310]